MLDSENVGFRERWIQRTLDSENIGFREHWIQRKCVLGGRDGAYGYGGYEFLRKPVTICLLVSGRERKDEMKSSSCSVRYMERLVSVHSA